MLFGAGRRKVELAMTKKYETDPRLPGGVPIMRPVGELHPEQKPMPKPEPPKREFG